MTMNGGKHVYATRRLNSLAACSSCWSRPPILANSSLSTLISFATMPESLRMLAIVDDIESAASAVSSTAAVIEVTVWAYASIASRMRCAEVCTSTIVCWIDWFANTDPLVAC